MQSGAKSGAPIPDLWDFLQAFEFSPVLPLQCPY